VMRGPDADGGEGGRGGSGGGGMATCKTACPSGQTCVAGTCAICGGFGMPNPATAGLPNPASYDTSVAGVVTDAVAGLTWEPAGAPGTHDQFAAAAYCANNRTAGISGWRPPTLTELISLVDFTVPSPGPTLDGAVFPGTPGEKFWTSTHCWGRTSDRVANAYVVDFGDGATGSSFVSGGGAALRTRCVVPSARGEGCCAPRRFTVAGSFSVATVTDASTKLVWQRSSSATAMTWAEANTTCAKASMRLPSMKELQTLIDTTVQFPEAMIDAAVFPKTPADSFWTSSLVAGGSHQACAVSFIGGVPFAIPTYDAGWVRCVR
jgi:hypothetical protein